MNWLRTLIGYRMQALIRKEFLQILRDRRLAMSLILPPTLQLLLFGFALNATVSNLRLGVVDDSRTPESRELVAIMTESKSFQGAGTYFDVNRMGKMIANGKLDAGLVIPYDYAKDLQRGRPVTVQVLLNAMNSNTATIGQGYAEGVIESYNQALPGNGIHAQFQQVAAPRVSRLGMVLMHPAYLYNPGLEPSWFIVTGILGVLLILNGSLISAAALVKERETGTLEQLLMSPASTTQIIIAKLFPLFVLLCLMGIMALVIMRIVFGIPFRGNILLVMSAAALCLLCGISIGTFLATFTKSARQAQLTLFFVNPPLTSLSGAFTPVEAMPKWLQPVAQLNPIQHFGQISRGAMLKGSGIGTLWPNFLALGAFTVVLVSLSIWRFRKQLS
ncbi:MAG TPA: ABC transporter permease [Candidatus Acidoferrales bacterium]|nr:ABC transporter permease [Candidatus Acidoferrales bacterium]